MAPRVDPGGRDEAVASSSSALERAEAPRCPHVGGRSFDPLDPIQAGDPFPWLLRAQEEAPIFYLEEYDVWCVTRYDEVLEVLGDTDTYSSSNTNHVTFAPEVAAEHPEEHPMSAGMVNLDPRRIPGCAGCLRRPSRQE